MGFFDLHCVESGLALIDSTALLVIAKQDGRWLPCATPAFDTYNRVGGLDEIHLDDAGEEILASVRVRSLPQGGEGIALEDLVSELCVAPGTWAERDTSYTLVDAGIYGAVAETMRQREGFDDASLDALSWPALVARAIPFVEARRRYERSESRDVTAMKDLVRFVAWGTDLRPASQLPSGQYCGLTRPNGRSADGYTLAAVDKARRRYAGFPLLLEAVEQNADRWSDLDPQEARDDRARQRGRPAVVRIERLFIARSMTGEHVLEVGATDVPLIARLLGERLRDRGEAVHLASSNFAVSFTPAATASWRKDHEEDRFVVEATADATNELIAAFLRATAKAVTLSAYPGLRLRT
jgi:hypothetical protein